MANKVKHKTHKGTKKVVNVKNSGLITIGHAGLRHNTGKLAAKNARKRREKQALSGSDYQKIKNVI